MNALVLAGDEGIAPGLAVAIHSAVDHLTTPIDVYVLDTGISAASRERLRRVHAGIQWVEVPANRLDGLPTTGHLPLGTYARLLIPDLLPGKERVVYLDGDVLVRDDLAPLFGLDLGEAPVAAVRDFEAPHLLDARNFSCGVLVLDVERWRSARLAERVLRYLVAHGETLRNLDQDALSLVNDEWVELDWRWNVQQSLTWLEGRPHHELTERLVSQRETLYREAAILHFSSTPKPWYHACTAPGTWLWVRSLIRSGYYRPYELARWLAPWLTKRAVGKVLPERLRSRAPS